MIEIPYSFMKKVDELVDYAEEDAELKEGLRWCDEESKRRGITFYEMVYFCLQTHDNMQKAKEWLTSKK